jgi:hypothetical protein
MGIFFGYEMRTKRVMYLDIRMLKRLGIIDSPVIVIIGRKNHGKSVLAKSMTLRMSALQTRQNALEGMLANRTWIQDRKRSSGRGEYADVTEFLMAEAIDLAHVGSINIFDVKMGMDEMDMVDTALAVANDVLERKLQRFETLAIQVAVHHMFHEMPAIASPDVLEMLLRAPKKASLRKYFNFVDGEFVKRFKAAHLSLDYVDVINKQLSSLPKSDQAALLTDEQVFAQFVEDSALMSACFGELLRATYGGQFGSERSLYDLLTDTVMHFDWSEVTGKAGDLLEAMMYKWQRIGMERNIPALTPDLVVGDEEASAISRLTHAQFKDEYVRKARAYSFVDINVTQWSTDYVNLGEPGSALRTYGQNINNGFGMRIIGAQPPTDEIRHEITRHGVSDEDAWTTTTLPIGCWGIHIPGQKMQFVQHVVLPSERTVIESNQANMAVTERILASETAVVRRRIARLAELNGTAQIGAAA